MVLDIRCTRDVSIGTLLLARGRDRLETRFTKTSIEIPDSFSYSLGDAIDWKQNEGKYYVSTPKSPTR